MAEKSTSTVTVACKLPHGMILRVFDMVEKDEAVMGGGFRTAKVAQERAARVMINGNAHPQNEAPRSQIAAGFALTHNVNKEFWEQWLSQNKDSDVVANGLIFAHGSESSAVAESKDKVAVRSGLERLDPAKLPKRIQKADTVPA